MHDRNSAKIIIICIEALGGFALGPCDFGLLEFGRDSAHHARRYSVLKIEDVGELAIEAVGPQMSAGGIDELPSDAHPAGRLAYAAFEYIADPEVTSDLAHIDGSAFVGECRIPRD